MIVCNCSFYWSHCFEPAEQRSVGRAAVYIRRSRLRGSGFDSFQIQFCIIVVMKKPFKINEANEFIWSNLLTNNELFCYQNLLKSKRHLFKISKHTDKTSVSITNNCTQTTNTPSLDTRRTVLHDMIEKTHPWPIFLNAQ